VTCGGAADFGTTSTAKHGLRFVINVIILRIYIWMESSVRNGCI